MPSVIFVPRKEWGASSATELFISNRVRDSRLDKREIHVHHTAAIDVNDNTPNRWDYDEAVAYMRRLQHSRPDLGPLPYSENYAVNEDLSIVWVFEGRGWDVRGAHTANHNASGVGLGAFGNFDKEDIPAAEAILHAMEIRVAQKRQEGYLNLGSKKSPKGWNAWGHRDSSNKTCPGHSLYPLLSSFRLLDSIEEDWMITKWLNEAAFRKLYQLKLAFSSSEDELVRHWVTNRHLRTDEEHASASSNILMAIAERAASGKGTLPKEEVVRLIRG